MSHETYGGNYEKNIILSFRPDYFRPILYGIKKYEYRRLFCDEPVTAYLYLTKPISQFIGVLELGKRISPEMVKSLYDNDEEICKRMDTAIDNNERSIIPIHSFSLFKETIRAEDLKHHGIPFTVPRSFTYIDGTNLLEYLSSLPIFKQEFYHSHSGIYEDNIGVSCIDMEKTEEFKVLDTLFLKSSKSNLVKTSYLSK